jgi:hypothetical protein
MSRDAEPSDVMWDAARGCLNDSWQAPATPFIEAQLDVIFQGPATFLRFPSTHHHFATNTFKQATAFACNFPTYSSSASQSIHLEVVAVSDT